MKFILIIMIFNTILSSQEAKSRCKLGFGMEYAPSLIVLGSEQPTPSIYFPIIKNNFLIEPIMTIKYEKDEDAIIGIDVQQTERLIAAGIGIYSLRNFDKFRSYAGVKILYGESLSVTEYDLNSSYSSMNSETNGYIIALSPTVGSEYIINNHFTIGGELEFMYSIDSERVYDYTHTTTSTQEESSIIFRPKFMVRFYF